MVVVECADGLRQVGLSLSPTYVVIVLPQRGHFHFCGLRFSEFSDIASSVHIVLSRTRYYKSTELLSISFYFCCLRRVRNRRLLSFAVIPPQTPNSIWTSAYSLQLSITAHVAHTLFAFRTVVLLWSSKNSSWRPIHAALSLQLIRSFSSFMSILLSFAFILGQVDLQHGKADLTRDLVLQQFAMIAAQLLAPQILLS